MRGERHVRNGITVLNDSYNSNPEAVRSMLDVLRDEQGSRRIAVLGEMLELGTMSNELHRKVGRWAVAAQVDVLVGIAGWSKEMIAEAQDAGLDKDRARFFPDPVSAGVYLKGITRAGDIVLFKGSRGTHVERALAALES
ncbi:MAG: hypothetical protein INR62_01500 [Rhodospirillales bacterium]|nr:hypothetical protein [Acetobacter sp.]